MSLFIGFTLIVILLLVMPPIGFLVTCLVIFYLAWKISTTAKKIVKKAKQWADEDIIDHEDKGAH